MLRRYWKNRTHRQEQNDNHQAISLESQRIELRRYPSTRGLEVKGGLSESRSANP